MKLEVYKQKLQGLSSMFKTMYKCLHYFNEDLNH